MIVSQERQFNVRRSMSPAIHNTSGLGLANPALAPSPHVTVARPVSPFGIAAASPAGNHGYLSASPGSGGLNRSLAPRDRRGSEVRHMPTCCFG